MWEDWNFDRWVEVNSFKRTKTDFIVPIVIFNSKIS